MQRTIALLALSAVLAAAGVRAAEEPSALKLKATGQYFLVEKAGSAAQPTLVVKRVGPSGTSYTKRAFDCAARSAMHVGSGESLEAMAKDKPDAEMTPLKKDSVTAQLWQLVCAKQ